MQGEGHGILSHAQGEGHKISFPSLGRVTSFSSLNFWVEILKNLNPASTSPRFNRGL